MASKEEAEARTEYWKQQVQAWRVSGQSQKSFCKTNDLDYRQFGYWVRKFRKPTDKAQSKQSSGFVPVTIRAQNEPIGLSLMLPNGVQLQGIANDNLPTVYQLLAHLS